MKKNYHLRVQSHPILKKLIMELKIVILIVLVSVSNIFASNSYSQTAKVTLDMENKTLEQVMDEIEQQSEFYFIFNQKQIDINRTVNVQVDNKLIDEILPDLFAGTNVNYAVLDRKILLTTEPLENDIMPFVSSNEFQQQIVTGKVTDSQTGEAMPGVNIRVKGTNVGTISDQDGKYSLSLTDRNVTLVFSFIGYVTQEVPVIGETTVDVALVSELKGLDEVIVIGYGTMKKSDLTGSIERVSSAAFKTRPITNIIEAFAGTVAGFYSAQGTYASGGGSMEIRGSTSLAANVSPLIVLDGVIYNGNIADINPNDIESIDILKDASSSAIFGSRAASGVVVITTKKGQASKPVINFSSKIGIVGLTNQLKPFGPEEYLTLKSDFFKRTRGQDMPPHYYTNPENLPDNISLQEWANYDASPSEDYIGMWLLRLALSPRETENYLAGKTYDWYDAITQNGIRQEYDASISGGAENLRYFFSSGYTHNKGITIGDEFKTFRSRFNLDADLSDFLKIGVNVHFADRDQGFERISLKDAVRMSPWNEPYDNEGQLIMYPNEWIYNPFIDYTYRDRLDKTQTLFANLFGEIKLPLGFSYRVNFSNNVLWRRNYLFDPIETQRGLSNNGYGYRSNQHNYEWMVDNLIKWNRIIANIHRLDFTFLVNAEKNQSWYDMQTNLNMEPSDKLGYHALQSGLNPSLQNSDSYSTGNALMARLNYTLMDKYMLTVSWRRDGYSAFGQANPYAQFPSAAFAWTISKEGFFNIDWITNLKLRTSWGVNGNRDIDPYAALSKLSTLKYLYGNTPASGVYTNSMSNRDLRWEQTQAINLGIDFGIYKSRINGNIDIYQSTTTDLLLFRSLPQIIGYSEVISNLGELRNKGIEVSLNSININNSNITWKSNFVFSHNRNKIISLYGDMIDIVDEDGKVIGQREADDLSMQWFIGQSIDRVWDYEFLGIWQLNEEDKAAVYSKDPGDVKLRDVDLDGLYTPADDKLFLGYKKPQYRLGFRNDIAFLKHFEFSAFIRADLGFLGRNNFYKNHDIGGGQFDRQNTYAFDYWTPENSTAKYPRLAVDISSPTFEVWRDRSFVRLQNLSLAFNFPMKYIERYKVQNLRVFIDVNNALTFTNWGHYDPESGETPMPKYITFGLNLGL